MNRWLLAAAALVLFPQIAWGQPHQPYAGHETRPIKALSAQQVADLKAGRGMGLALAAELNGYPGPMHVLELAQSLGLSTEQVARMTGLFEAMKAEAIGLGETLIAAEAALDRQFAQRSITAAGLSDGVKKISAVQAALREAHLKYHLATVEVLTPAQIAHYAELRGYADSGHTPRRH